MRQTVLPNARPEACLQDPDALWLDLWPKTLHLVGWDQEIPRSRDIVAAMQLLLDGMMSRQSHKISTTKVTITLDSFCFWERISQQAHALGRPLYASPFKDVQDLRIYFGMESKDSDEEVVSFASAELGKWLNSAPQLTKLELLVTNFEGLPWRLLSHMSSTALPSLTDLNIGVEATEQEFLSFLQHRGSSLRRLTVNCCTLLDGSWESTLSRIPDVCPDLVYVSLDGPLHHRDAVWYLSDISRLVEKPHWLDDYTGYVLHRNAAPSFDVTGLPSAGSSRSLGGRALDFTAPDAVDSAEAAAADDSNEHLDEVDSAHPNDDYLNYLSYTSYEDLDTEDEDWCSDDSSTPSSVHWYDLNEDPSEESYPEMEMLSEIPGGLDSE